MISIRNAAVYPVAFLRGYGSTRFQSPNAARNGQHRHRRIVFIGKYVHRNISGGIGHSLPQEAPGAFANAVRRAVSL
jgi:hypothetical protein